MSDQKTAIQLAAEKVTPPPTKTQLIKASAIILYQENEKKIAEHEKLIDAANSKVNTLIRSALLKTRRVSAAYHFSDNNKNEHVISGNYSRITVGEFPKLDTAIADLQALKMACPPRVDVATYVCRITKASQAAEIDPVKAMVNDPDLRKKLAEAATQLLNSHENKQAIKV